jgi:hypothetical protein
MRGRATSGLSITDYFFRISIYKVWSGQVPVKAHKQPSDSGCCGERGCPID